MAKKQYDLTILGLIRKKFTCLKNQLMSVNVDQIVISDKLNHYNDGYKYFMVTKKVKLLNC